MGFGASGVLRRGHEGPTSRTRSDLSLWRSSASRSWRRATAAACLARRQLTAVARAAGMGIGGRPPSIGPTEVRGRRRQHYGSRPSSSLLAAAWRSSVTRGRARATATATAPGAATTVAAMATIGPTTAIDRTTPSTPYYSSYWPGVSLSFGWGYGSSWPYYAGGYYDSPGYAVGVYAPYAAGAVTTAAHRLRRARCRALVRGPSGRVRLEVRPDDTSVYVDDEFRGNARETRILNLPPGRHLIELVRPGFPVERREVTVVSGESQDVLVELLRP